MTFVPFALGAVLVWREGAQLPQPRAGYIAGALDNHFVIAGGSYWKDDQKVWSDRTDLFDPRTDRWSAGPPLPHVLSDAASSTLGEAVYVFGGIANGKLFDDILKLDRNGWNVLEDTRLPEPRMYSVAATLGDAIYILGGLSVAGDLKTATTDLLRWEPGKPCQKLASFPGLARVSAAFTAAGGRLYVFGGAHQEGGQVRNLNDAWVYDPVTNRWEELPSLPMARRAWSAFASNDYTVVISGGYTDSFSSEVYEFDIRTRKTRIAGKLPHGLADAKYVRVGSTIVTAGGESGIKIRSPWTLLATAKEQ